MEFDAILHLVDAMFLSQANESIVVKYMTQFFGLIRKHGMSVTSVYDQ